MKPLTICADCGGRHREDGARCRPCSLAHQRARNATRAAYYDATHRRHSRQARRAQPWCSICGGKLNLTWDHEHGQVECRSCNSSHRRNVG